MASILLDSIINDTVENFRDRTSGLLATTDSSNNTPVNLVTMSTLSPSQSQQPQQFPSLDQGAEGSFMPVMSQAERLFWILLFSLMVLVAAGGNTIVIYIVSTNKEMKSVTNYFLVNLSLADTMVSTLNVIFNFISMLDSHWPFGSIYCKISNFIAILSISASVFTLTAISCDRYNAILHPLRPRMSHRHALGWILLIWTLSAALAMPNMIYSAVLEDRLADEHVALTCAMMWPDGRYPSSSYDHIYNIIVLVVTYLVPILTMAILYYNVGRELWGYEAIGENVEKQARAILAKRKIVKMMIVVVIIFALCWLPYHAFFVVSYYLASVFQDASLLYQRCYLIMYWLAMSNSMYNPIIIYFMNSKFRHEFRRVLCFFFCCRAYSPPQEAIDQHQQHHHHGSSSARSQQANKAFRRQMSSASAASNGPTSRTAAPTDQPARSSNHRATSSSGAACGNGTTVQVIVTQSDDNCDDHGLKETHKTRLNGAPRDRNGPESQSHEREPFLNRSNHHRGPDNQQTHQLGGDSNNKSKQAAWPTSNKVWI